MSLTAKEEEYCQKYVKLLNKTKAALGAGYSKNTARQIGYENFTKPYIRERIEEIRQEIKEQLGIDDHSVITELANLSFWNIKDFIQGNNAVKDLSKMSKQKLKPVAGIKIKETVTTFGETTRTEVTTELRMVDKRAGIIDLGRHLGIFEKDNKQKSMKIRVTRK